MIRDLTEIDTSNRKEGHAGGEKAKAPAAGTSTQLSRFKDVRIVRVSRGFGGKDRHSKVCTVRGLRDRRVRLSVPTAIQLYNLQDRLGLSQPSKVVDWLLNVAKHDIDKLPPLPMLPENFGLMNHSSGVTSGQNSSPPLNKGRLINFSKNINLENSGGLTRQNTWSSNSHWRSNSKLHRETNVIEKEDWTSNTDGEGRKESCECHGGASAHLSSSNLSHRGNHPPLLGLLNSMPLGYHWEPPNLSLSQSRNHGFAYQADDRSYNVDVASLPPPLSLSAGMPQFFVCSPGVAQSYIPAHATSSIEIDPRNINLAVPSGQMMSASSQPQLSYSFHSSLHPTNHPMKSITLSMRTDNPFQPTHNSDRQSHETRRDFPS